MKYIKYKGNQITEGRFRKNVYIFFKSTRVHTVVKRNPLDTDRSKTISIFNQTQAVLQKHKLFFHKRKTKVKRIG